MTIQTKTSVRSGNDHTHFRALEEAREAVTALRTLKPLLSPQDEETLTILIDKELMRHLEKSLKEETQGRVMPLKSILK